MEEYLILVNPSHNKVYFNEAKDMYVNELKIGLKACLEREVEVYKTYVAGVFYLGFKAEINDLVLKMVKKMSFTLAVFKVQKEGSLLPLALPDVNYLDSGISSILKYTGKTNEYFTRMMINLGYFSMDKELRNEDVSVLDPVAGKGTTLYEAVSFGYDAYGIEICQKVCLESYQYMKKFLESQKLKHTAKEDKINVLKTTAKRFAIDMAKTKEELKNKKTRHFELVAFDNEFTGDIYKKNTFSLIVGDLPYGVQHGNIVGSGQKKRSPLELLDLSLDGFKKVLKKGGCLVLSWNSFTLKRSDFIKLLKDKGYFVFEEDEYCQFLHRVDNAIKRDLIVAKKI